MRTIHLPLLLAAALSLLIAGMALAGDIVTVPTANQVKAGEADVAIYYIGVDRDALIPPLRPIGIEFVRAQTLYVGLTDQVELDVHRYDVDKIGAETIFNATVVVQDETLQHPIVVVGGRDLSRAYGHASYFVSAAKTLNPPVGGPPTGPIYRAHLSLGTEDNTLFGEGRHEGLFGGLQVLVRPMYPQVGVVALYDGRDVITALTYTQDKKWPTVKGGTFGGHWWLGSSYTFNAK
jgi:hypothetical protein